MRTASGPSLRTVSSIAPGSSTRALDRELLDRRPAPLAEAGPAEHGERADRGRDQQQRQRGPAATRGAARLRGDRGRATPAPSISLHLEEALPAELGELGLVGVEHELPGVREAPLEDPALALAEHHGVGELGRLPRRARREVVEEVAVQVERVDEVVLERR